jgi:poly-gamma-glutamate synthesis protein (capsule biosynthesis protein)
VPDRAAAGTLSHQPASVGLRRNRRRRSSSVVVGRRRSSSAVVDGRRRLSTSAHRATRKRMVEDTPSPPPASPPSAVRAARGRLRTVAVAIAVGLLIGAVVAGVRALATRPPPFSWTPSPARAFSPGKQRVQLVFGGDVSVARGVGDSIDRAGGDPAWLLAQVRPIFDAADLVFANLECVLSDDDELPAADKKFKIRGTPADARALVQGGIDVVSVANNHAMDYLYAGFFSTLQATTDLGLLVTGVKEDDGQRLLVVAVGQMKVGFLAYNAHGDEWAHLDWRPRSAPYDIDEVLRDVAAARSQVDQLVVSLHWGPELSHEPWDWQRADAHRLVDAGVDLVIGHHPHVEQPVEQYKDGLIAYSLGDLVFDKKTPWLRARTGPRFLLAVDFDGTKRTGFHLLPIRHDRDFRPYPAPEQDTGSFVWPAGTTTTASTTAGQTGATKPAPWKASDHVERARVRRGADACDTFATRRPRLNGGWLRWIDRRWVCPGEPKFPGDSVGRSTELSATILRTGVWASPGGGDVVVAFDDVPVGGALHFFAGFPDWATQAANEKAVTTTTTVQVRVGGAAVHTAELPAQPGWREASIDTSAQAGKVVDVDVVVRGPRYPQPGFLFELEVR